jgi:UDP-N-acetyl-D-glucosamine/UDP-N-acetyl-D-galactosamine dehydrogenase
MMMFSEISLAVIGLGYVGLPLAVEFGKSIPVMGFDINEDRIQALRESKDHTLELTSDQILESKYLSFSVSVEDLRSKNVFIVTVPTPIDENNSPDFSPLCSASRMLGGLLKRGDIVIYESTVYPGATEEVCVPILEAVSGLVFNKDFFAGYSPERINPGDKQNTLTKIKKITSGSTPEAAKLIDQLYRSIISAGTHLTSSIKVAEAAKVIENTQRDLNIAIINEFAKIFNKLDIDTQEILEAAGTKWNFLPFKPGLVGGHCISVDPYYLTYKAKEIGYQPEVILAGRSINDGMGQYVATQLVKKINSKNIHIVDAKILILGFTFKGDCPDVRNTKIIDIYNELESFSMKVDVHDHWANPREVRHEYGIKLIDNLADDTYDAIIIAVDHSDYKSWGESKIRKLGKGSHILYDLKYSLPKSASDLRL